MYFDWIRLTEAYKYLDEKVQKNCLMTLKCDEMFELKNYREVMCHDTKG